MLQQFLETPLSPPPPSTTPFSPTTRARGEEAKAAAGAEAAEFVLPVLIQNAEFAQRQSVLVDEITDDLIAEAAEEATERGDGSVECYDSEEEDDSEDDDEEADDDDDDDDDDDLSLSGQSYIRSGEMSTDRLVFIEEEDSDAAEKEPIQQEVKKPRVVHFALDEATGQILCREHDSSFTQHIRSKEKELCWYRRRDFKAFKASVQRDMAEIRQSPHFAHYLKVFHACSSSAQMRSISLTPQDVARLADTPFRGYELQVFGATLMPHRARIHSQVLEAHMQHKNLSTVMTASERWEALGVKCRDLTKKNRRLAHLMGWGDSAMAGGTGASTLPPWLQRTTSEDDWSVMSSGSSASSLQCSSPAPNSSSRPGIPTTAGTKSPFKAIPRQTKSSEGGSKKKSPVKARSILTAGRLALGRSPLKATTKVGLPKTTTAGASTSPTKKPADGTAASSPTSKSSSPQRKALFQSHALYITPTQISSVIDVRSLLSPPDLSPNQQQQQQQQQSNPPNPAPRTPKRTGSNTTTSSSSMPRRSHSDACCSALLVESSPCNKTPLRNLETTPSFKPQVMLEL